LKRLSISGEGQLVNVCDWCDLPLHEMVVLRQVLNWISVGPMMCFCEHAGERTDFMLGLAEKVSDLQGTLLRIITVGTVFKLIRKLHLAD
jgi:hypothetical protein